MAPAKALLRRDEVDPSQGVLDPHDINNAGFFFLFALIGVAFVLGGIWFFFWAKDGGFHFREDDWDDYKSTVLRRKGPNGTVLSNATRSTKLGGGSVYKGYDEDDADGSRTVITESTGLSGITAGPSDIYAREKREEKRRQRREKKRAGGSSRKEGKGDKGDKGVTDEVAERAAREQLRNYRHERAARVGGLNKEAEGSEWEGSTNAESSVAGRTEGSRTDISGRTEGSRTDVSGRTETSRTDILGRTERSSAGGGGKEGGKARGGGIRKVYSVADRTTARENERLREEARRMREQGAVVRRDFSYQRATGAASQSQLSESLLESGSEGGTKSYHHPLPELKEHRRREREREREGRRARRGGYVRGNTIDEEVD